MSADPSARARKSRPSFPDRRTLNRFAPRLFTLGSQPTWELIAIFGLGVVFLSVFSNWLYGVAREPRDLATLHSVGVICVLIALPVAAYLLYRRYQDGLEHRFQIKASFVESATVPQRRGLIWLLSPGAIDHPTLAIRHHYGQGEPHPLQYCWLIITRGDRRIEEARQALQERLEAMNVDVTLCTMEVPRPDVESAYRAVDRICQEELAGRGLRPDEVIADITGGLKPMTAGLTLACLVRDVDLEYVETDRDELGRPIDGTQRVVMVNAEFFQARQQSK